jgi:hypothetical protein
MPINSKYNGETVPGIGVGVLLAIQALEKACNEVNWVDVKKGRNPMDTQE